MSVIKNENIDGVLPMVLDYQQNPSKAKLNEVIESLAPYIRNYPQFAFRKNDDDIKSDFFLYILERFDGFLVKYDHSLSNFSTYLSIKLKNHFLNYLRREQSRNKLTVYSYEIDSLSETIFNEDEHSWKTSEEEKIDVHTEKLEKEIFADSQKNSFRYLCVKLYFFDFFKEEDFLLLKEHTKKTYSVLLSEINNFAEEIARKKRNKLKYEFRLNKIHYKIIKISDEIKNTPTENVEKIEELQKKLNSRRDEVLIRYNSVSVRPTMRAVADILSADVSKVQNVINYFKSGIKKRDPRGFNLGLEEF